MDEYVVLKRIEIGYDEVEHIKITTCGSNYSIALKNLDQVEMQGTLLVLNILNPDSSLVIRMPYALEMETYRKKHGRKMWQITFISSTNFQIITD